MTSLGVCIDLTAFGADRIHCGIEFQKFCNEWANVRNSLWGACVVAVGHYYLIGTGGMTFYQQITMMQYINSLMGEVASRYECSEDVNSNANGEAVEEVCNANGLTSASSSVREIVLVEFRQE